MSRCPLLASRYDCMVAYDRIYDAYDVFYCMLTCVALDFHAHLKGTCFTKKNSNRTETHKIEALQHSNLSSI